MLLQIWVTQYIRKTNVLNNQNTLLICNIFFSIEWKYPSVLHVSPNVEDGSPIHCIHFKSTKRDLHKSIKGLQVQPIMQVVFDCKWFTQVVSVLKFQQYHFDPQFGICDSSLSLFEYLGGLKSLAALNFGRFEKRSFKA
jgi:hypothetical protein